MKKYRCKIDTPWTKKGQLVTDLLADIVNAANYPDMFEEIPDRWIPNIGETHWFLRHDAEKIFCVREAVWSGGEGDQIDLKAHNIFRTKHKAESVLAKILKLLEEEKEL